MKDRPPEPEAATGGDPSSEDAVDLIERVAAAYATSAHGDDTVGSHLVGRVIGSYRVLRRLSRGGMGDVYRAERADGAYDAAVAVKLLRAGVDAETLAARFRRERQILARLNHPNIARLLDGGSSADGIPYLVMELVDGESLIAYADGHGLDLDARLDLFATVCDAVAYAHRNLVVHRDLKPANILVTADGTVKLLDFGIGKLLEDDGDAGLTRTGLLPMTPAYAAPEQVLGEPVTTATDAYALGVVLYELLTGSRPHDRDTRPLTALAGAVETEVTTRPSETLRRRGGDSRTQRTARALRGDLDTIVLAALRRRPERRYPSADALAEDLRRYREGRPIRARPDTAGYRARKFLRRHRLGVAAAGLVVLALTTGLTAALWQAREARDEARRAAAVQAFLIDIFRANTSRQPDPVRARRTTARELLDLGAERIESSLEVAPATRLTMTRVLGELYQELAVDERAVRLRRQAVDLARRVHGPASIELAAALVDLAESLHASTQVEQRQGVLDEAAGILDELGPEDSPLRRRLLVQQAQHALSSDLPAALDYAERAVELYAGAASSESFAEALYIQGVARYMSGSDEAAVAALRRAVEVSNAAQGFPNPSSPRYYSWLGDLQFRLLDIRGAEESHRQALIAARAVNGESHVDTLQTKLRLGRILCGTGRVREGRELLRQARDLALETRGPQDPFHTPQALLEHGFCLARSGRLQQGLADMEAGLADWRESRPGTVYLAHMLESVAGSLVETGRDGRAEELLDEAARVREEAGQARRTPTWNFHVATRIRLQLARGRSDRAEELLKEFVVEDRAGRSTSLSQIARWILAAEVLQAAGDDSGAAARARRVRRTIEAAGVEDYLALQLAEADLVLGRAELRRGSPRAARPWLERALEARTAILLPESVRIAEAQVALAACLQELGHTAEARALIEGARSIHAAHESVAEHYVEGLRSVASVVAAD